MPKKGKAAYADGRIYEGEFKDGLHHGNGTLTFPHGERFVGEFRKNRYHKGTYYFKNGDKLVGFINKDGCLEGTYYLEDGRSKYATYGTDGYIIK